MVNALLSFLPTAVPPGRHIGVDVTWGQHNVIGAVAVTVLLSVKHVAKGGPSRMQGCGIGDCHRCAQPLLMGLSDEG